MPLSEFAARKAKPADKPYKLTDGGGLFLHVQPGGSKLWRLKYRFDNKEKLLSFGPYPRTTIAEARSKRDHAKKLLAAGRPWQVCSRASSTSHEGPERLFDHGRIATIAF
jgi:hypothetical protein